MGKYYREHYPGVYRGIEQAHSIDPPRLIISSLETLKNRLSHPKIVKLDPSSAIEDGHPPTRFTFTVVCRGRK